MSQNTTTLSRSGTCSGDYGVFVFRVRFDYSPELFCFSDCLAFFLVFLLLSLILNPSLFKFIISIPKFVHSTLQIEQINNPPHV
ncbi:hypothetical protein DSY1374 [Desulfitobacterium hafniense Y51]|uniref:Uncharacterized protein n=1 Tax=Desulfitobacterium hafniense (strain Y51) TaxID=138119 RepID=Q24XS9_DESHY|nr:hypothetical protein DSY1374 [Desulfitobacterium hafniense Y51]